MHEAVWGPQRSTPRAVDRPSQPRAAWRTRAPPRTQRGARPRVSLRRCAHAHARASSCVRYGGFSLLVRTQCMPRACVRARDCMCVLAVCVRLCVGKRGPACRMREGGEEGGRKQGREKERKGRGNMRERGRVRTNLRVKDRLRGRMEPTTLVSSRAGDHVEVAGSEEEAERCGVAKAPSEAQDDACTRASTRSV
eukprot:6182550-Pleurochrysis_carterae.AAC.1